MNKTIHCGKVDWYGKGKRLNAVELELRLEQKDGNYIFSCCGSVWDSRHNDWIAGGQCYDELLKFPELEKYKEVFDMWKKHANNDLTPGSPKQEAAVEAWTARREKAGKRYDYTEACRMLEKKGLLVDKSYIHKGKPYEYGTAWLVRDIPEKDLALIRKWMDIGPDQLAN